MRIAVLGATGQLGRDLVTRLPGEVVPLGRGDCDLTRPESIATAVTAAAPTVLVNCAAYNFVDRAESEPEAAAAVNAWGVRYLAGCCAAAGVPLVHFSSDYVFGLDATRESPLGENDPPGPLNVYGGTKLLGEYFVLAASAKNLVIRTCGLYGRPGAAGKGGNFVETMLRLAGEGRPLRVVDDQRCTPSSTADVADATVALLRAGASGLFHVTNAGSCTWFEFAREIFRLAGLKPSLTAIRSAESGRAARRPAFSVLSNAKLAALGIPPPRHWTEALASYLIDRGLTPLASRQSPVAP